MPWRSSPTQDDCQRPGRACWTDHRDDDRISKGLGQDHESVHKRTVCSSETVVDRILSLPQEKPALGHILRVTVQANGREWKLVRTQHGNKVIAWGDLSVDVEYVAQSSEQSMHYAHFTVPYYGFYVACPRRFKTVMSHVDHVHHNIIDPRSISITVLLSTHTA